VTASLVFRQPAATSARLVFGVGDGGMGGPVIPAVDLALDGYFPEMELSCALEYRSDTQRPLVASLQPEWQEAAHAPAGTAARMRDARKYPQGWQALWRKAISAALPLRMRQPKVLQPDRRGAAVVFQRAQPLHAAGCVDSQSGQPQHLGHLGAYQLALPQRLRVCLRQQDGLRDRRPHASGRSQIAQPFQVGLGTDFQQGVPAPVLWAARFQPAMQPLVGISVPGGAGPVTPPQKPPCYTPDPHLVFTAARVLDGRLIFVCKGGVITPPAHVSVPIRRVYIVRNTISLIRVDSGAEVKAHGFTMSLDYQSWTWSWNASLHYDAAPHLGRETNGDPAEFAVEINGTPFRLRLERKGRDRRFLPQERWQVSGKGRAAVLAAPWAPVLSFGNPENQRTAQQLAIDALTINGVSIGWDVDWQLQDWLVPAGAWAIQGSYMEALNDIASAAGGYIQPHNTEKVLRFLPKYPTAPWNWADVTPDFEIPAMAAEVETTEFIDKPEYNRVFVGGQGIGVFGPITRAGTPGDKIAPQVTHPLITAAEVQRARAIAELADTGSQEIITLSLQVLPETGVILPGSFVRYAGDQPVIGIVRSTSIEWSSPRLRQSLEIETHV